MSEGQQNLEEMHIWTRKESKELAGMTTVKSRPKQKTVKAWLKKKTMDRQDLAGHALFVDVPVEFVPFHGRVPVHVHLFENKFIFKNKRSVKIDVEPFSVRSAPSRSTPLSRPRPPQRNPTL
jgi:hypothetical protein